MKKIKSFFVKVLGNEKTQALAIPLFAILLGLILGGIIIAILGNNPLEAYKNLLQGSGLLPKASYAGSKGMLTDFFSFLDSLAPMIFAALAVSVALVAGIFNIGVSGQMLTSGFVATVLIGYSDLPGIVAKPLVIVVGVVVGALIGGLIGWLKYRFNINEVVASIMINYIAQYIISFFITTQFINPVSRQSKEISAAARLTLKNQALFGLKVDLPLAIFLAILMAILLKIMMDKTKVGYELKAVGLSPKAARYTGINIGKSIITTMILSGGLAGLAGVSYYLGYFGSIQPKVLPGMGFEAIAVALLGNNNPIGILFSSFFITTVSKGSTYMSSTTGIEAEIAAVITAVILLFSACSAYIKYKVSNWKSELTVEKGDQ
ncbi:ABC transporter permease [Enterococcus rivorum]|uniref:ABC transporter permease n=1 Tax=Enterococcus rivorum TaxID=762845 RepID=A0A1E5KVB8_9ENTE|nr:ABC transporter permease [Enterococcus rivorum]MBP2100386.1 simple sugar transport system permease protein [Enterococcus rivorum]OEH81770.1 ABC transporter permease [Enterococcus rivorum]